MSGPSFAEFGLRDAGERVNRPGGQERGSREQMANPHPHPTMSFVVSPFDAQHYASARALWETTPGVGLSEADGPAEIAAFLRRNPGLSFVAHEDGELVGTILVGHDGRRGLIHHLVCAPRLRRRGVGRELLQRGLRGLHAEGIMKCHLFVFRNNTEGLSFWRAVQAMERHELALFSLGTQCVALPGD